MQYKVNRTDKQNRVKAGPRTFGVSHKIDKIVNAAIDIIVRDIFWLTKTGFNVRFNLIIKRIHFSMVNRSMFSMLSDFALIKAI